MGLMLDGRRAETSRSIRKLHACTMRGICRMRAYDRIWLDENDVEPVSEDLNLTGAAMKRYLVTGAHGFVGGAVCAALRDHGAEVTGLVRRPAPLAEGITPWVFDGLDFDGLAEAWASAALACDCVIHLAARVHMMNDTVAEPLTAYRAINRDGALRVAQAALQAGVKRFVYVSSIKALGDGDRGQPWREDDLPLALDAYGQSKREAESALLELGRTSGLEVVILRPPLVYGPGVRANFLRLLTALQRGLPLPLGAVTARRSLISVSNLVDALIVSSTHPAAAGRIFHVTDGVDLSTPDLARLLAEMLHRPARLVPVPLPLLRLAGQVTGRTAEISRLISPLQVDSSLIRRELGWAPPLSVEQGLMDTVAWHQATQ